MFLIQW